MTQVIDLGKLRFYFAGQWSNSTTYEQNDVVKYGGNVYVYTYNLKTSGNAPTDTTYWKLMIEGFDFEGQWDSTATYNIGQGVAYGGKVYIALQQAASINPQGRDSYWSTFVDGIQWEGNYAADSDYQLGDVVKYGGSAYIAKTNTTGNIPTDTTYWDEFVSGVSYKAVYNNATAYVKDEVVAYGANLYKAKQETTGNIPTNSTYWEIYIPGTDFRGAFDSSSTYYPNELVSRGGHLFRARTTVTGVQPNADSDGNFSVITKGFNFRDTWASGTTYFPGDTIKYGGSVYQAKLASTGEVPSTATTYWDKIVKGINFRQDWTTATAYAIDDVVRHGGNSYIAIADHTSGTTFDSAWDADYWDKFNSGIRFRGAYAGSTRYLRDDIVTNGTSAYIVDSDFTSSGSFSNDDSDGYFSTFAAGDAAAGLPNITNADVGKVIAVNDATSGYHLTWADDALNNFWVAKDGIDDSERGRSKNAPFKTVRFALGYINNNVSEDSAAHLEVAEGVYEEILPIRVPPLTTIRGQGLRNSEIKPAAGYDSAAAMFYLSNGNLIEALLFTGMSGFVPDSAEPDNIEAAYDSDATYPDSGGHAARPIKGVFLRLDPIRRISGKSPYIKHCTAISTGGIGALIDGKHLSTDSTTFGSMVFHAFTQIHSDGVGFWVRNNGKSEIVSCFTYYCHFGYVTSGGGHIRALNGNNSYGNYGTVSYGFDSDETLLTGNVRGYQLLYKDGTITNGEFERGDVIQTPSRNGRAQYITRTNPGIVQFSGAPQHKGQPYEFRTKDRIKFENISPAQWDSSLSGTEFSIQRIDSSSFRVYTDSDLGQGWNSVNLGGYQTSSVSVQDLIRANPMRFEVLSHNFDSYSMIKVTNLVGTPEAQNQHYLVDSHTSSVIRVKDAERSYLQVTGDSNGYAITGTAGGTSLNLLASKDSAITLWRGSSYNFVVDSSVTQNPLYIASQDSTNWIKGAFQHEYTTSAFGRPVRNSRAVGAPNKVKDKRTLKIIIDSNAPDTLHLLSGQSITNGCARTLNIINAPTADATGFTAYTSGGTLTYIDSGVEFDSANVKFLGSSALVTSNQNATSRVLIDNIKGSGFREGDSIAESGGDVFALLLDSDTVRGHSGFVLTFKGFTANKPRPGGSLTYHTVGDNQGDSGYDSNSYVIQTVSDYDSAKGFATIVFSTTKPTSDPDAKHRYGWDSQPVKIRYKYSQARLTGHDFLNIGFGNKTETNYPDNPSGALTQGNEVIEKEGGRVYYVTTDQDGNFRVGNYFRIDQATGRATLDASAFDLAGLSSLRLGSIGAKLGETINEFSSDTSLAGNSNQAVPTERAVKTYVDNTAAFNQRTLTLPKTGQKGEIGFEQYIGFDIKNLRTDHKVENSLRSIGNHHLRQKKGS